MGVVEKYGALIRKTAVRHPGRARRLIRIGLLYERARLRAKRGGPVPKALNELNRLAIRSVARALGDPQNAAWVNLFAPAELLHGFDLTPMSIEVFTAFAGGFHIEDFLLRRAEAMGMSDTLCSYHKGFLGAVDADLLETPRVSITTTLACDCNANTFRYLSARTGDEAFILDIPYENSETSVSYAAAQIEDLVRLLERRTGRRFDERALGAALARENEARSLNEACLAMQAKKDYPATLTLHMFKLFATHLLAGSEEALHYYRTLAEDLRGYPDTEAMKILWIHLMPYYQPTLKSYFNNNPLYRIVASDFDFDYGLGERLDESHPIEALARKMVENIYNGPYERKTAAALQAAESLGVDGVIHFCHWGCKQSAGGAAEMKRAFDDSGHPFLILDGDGVDQRNDADGQIRTRTEAFFEMVRARK
ncbi:MAG: 2-hydroxyacyl-CoA dehydratase family protein [Clostridiales Family XIII bacterium]|jgi:benzoyl-CoA reductase/2-hydroxyglutaryl-CoA dehydratase subunit BcrC/BadD/HgdB|nr:2-hydroxyacyl-CoA dehydratase family protein [Clostridiales Family XIII bacterium]